MSLEEIFAEIKGRLKSPFLGSFVIAWSVLNWRIPIALFFYKHKEVTLDHYRSYIDLIASNYTRWNGFWLPLWISIGYCLVTKPLLTWMITVVERFTDSIVHEIRKTEMVPREKLLNARAKYDRLTKEIDARDERESSLDIQLVDARRALASKEITISELHARLEKSAVEIRALKSAGQTYDHIVDSSFLNGHWKVSLKTSINNEIVRWRISNNLVTLSDNSSEVMTAFVLNDVTQQLTFAFENTTSKNSRLFRMTYSDSGDRLTGFSPGQFEDSNITMERIPD